MDWKERYFGEGLDIPEREPEPETKSHKLMKTAATVFLIVVAVYMLRTISGMRYWCEDRNEQMFRRCLQDSKDFRWCWSQIHPV